MKTAMYSQFIKTLFLFAAAFLLNLTGNAATKGSDPKDNASRQKIMLALLLDTSNSMDGLIDQAKSQLWRIVNQLAMARCDDGARPEIRIALYEYGNDNLPSGEGYIRQVSPLTADLDVISEKLFSLTTNGGNEFCGQVIHKSLNQLEWSSSGADLKLIFIAGNEPFTQGPVSYSVACTLAKEKDVVVNTIYCGSFNEGLYTNWKTGADLTGGTYMSIQQNEKTVYIATPYDTRIDELNDRLNRTYLYYGKQGQAKKEMQEAQDNNAAAYGQENKVERAISKSSHAYNNATWDLVDASKDNEKVLREAEEKELPREMQGLTSDQRVAYVKKKAEERAVIQKEIQALSTKRQEFINKNQPAADKQMLDGALINAIKLQARSKKLTW